MDALLQGHGDPQSLRLNWGLWLLGPCYLPIPSECAALEIIKRPFFTFAVPERHITPSALQMLVIAEVRCILFFNQASHVGRATFFSHVLFELRLLFESLFHCFVHFYVNSVFLL